MYDDDLFLHNLGGNIANSGLQQSAYSRNNSYIPLPELPPQVVIGLYAVFPTNSYAAIQVNGSFTINWGDGTIENYSHGQTAQHLYLYDSLPESSLDNRGFKQAVVTITPQNNQVLSSLNFNVKHQSAQGPSAYVTGWVDLEIITPNLTSISLGGVSSAIQHRLLEQFKLTASHLTSYSYLFNNCISLRRVLALNSSELVTSFKGMFYNCHQLDEFPTLDTANATDLSYLFYNCYALRAIPALVTSQCKNFSYMCYSCLSMKELPVMDTAAGEDFEAMLTNCYALKEIFGLNLANARKMTRFVENCVLLKYLTLMGVKIDLDLSSAKLSPSELVKIFTNLGTAPRVINIANSWGSPLLTAAQRQIALAKGWTIIG